MSCSTSRTVTPSSRSCAQQVGERALFRRPQAGGRLVEHDQRRVGGKRAGDFEDALAAERQIARRVRAAWRRARRASSWRSASARARASSARSSRSAPLRKPAPVAQVGAEQRHCRSATCSGAASRAGRCARCRRRRSRRCAACGDVVAEKDDRAGVDRQRAGDEVEYGALAGAVRADQADDLARADLEPDLADGSGRRSASRAISTTSSGSPGFGIVRLCSGSALRDCAAQRGAADGAARTASRRRGRIAARST